MSDENFVKAWFKLFYWTKVTKFVKMTKISDYRYF